MAHGGERRTRGVHKAVKAADEFIEVYATCHDAIHAAVLFSGNRAELKQVYASCWTNGRVACKKTGRWRWMADNCNWKCQVRHTLYTTAKFARCPDDPDWWQIAPSYSNIQPKVVLVRADAMDGSDPSLAAAGTAAGAASAAAELPCAPAAAGRKRPHAASAANGKLHTMAGGQGAEEEAQNAKAGSGSSDDGYGRNPHHRRAVPLPSGPLATGPAPARHQANKRSRQQAELDMEEEAAAQLMSLCTACPARPPSHHDKELPRTARASQGPTRAEVQRRASSSSSAGAVAPCAPAAPAAPARVRPATAPEAVQFHPNLPPMQLHKQQQGQQQQAAVGSRVPSSSSGAASSPAMPSSRTASGSSAPELEAGSSLGPGLDKQSAVQQQQPAEQPMRGGAKAPASSKDDQQQQQCRLLQNGSGGSSVAEGAGPARQQRGSESSGDVGSSPSASMLHLQHAMALLAQCEVLQGAAGASSLAQMLAREHVQRQAMLLQPQQQGILSGLAAAARGAGAAPASHMPSVVLQGLMQAQLLQNLAAAHQQQQQYIPGGQLSMPALWTAAGMPHANDA